SPHIILAGDGATKFARIMGHGFHDPETEKSRAVRQKTLEKLDDPSNQEDGIAGFRKLVNAKNYLSTDTVGAVTRVSGRFAGAVSTGGSSPMLRGRVGDVPIPGAGIYVGDEGAVVATGVGEEIIKRILCHRVYMRIIEDSLLDVLREEISCFAHPVGLIAVNRKEHA
ncbi:Peptidase T2, asparaginase 2, partial [mine drainage metagenome]